MKPYLKITTLLLATAFTLDLTGCSTVNKNNDTQPQPLSRQEKRYLVGSNAVTPVIVPRGLSSSKLKNYYAVPAGAINPSNVSPSTVPPNSNLQRFSKNNVKAMGQTMPVAATTIATLAKTKSGEQVLSVKLNPEKAWGPIGIALKQSHFQVLDQDKSMGSYFILDPSMTNNKITAKTPIYRVDIQPQGKQSKVAILDQTNHPAEAVATAKILGALNANLHA